MEPLQHITRLLKENALDEALAAAAEALRSAPDDASLLYIHGKVLWRMGRRTEAMSSYSAAAVADPSGPAAVALEQAREVIHFYNPDMLNP